MPHYRTIRGLPLRVWVKGSIVASSSSLKATGEQRKKKKVRYLTNANPDPKERAAGQGRRELLKTTRDAAAV